MTTTEFDLIRFLGHFHPVLVHFPIGAVLLVAGLEVVALRKAWAGAAGSVRAILLMTAPAAVAAAACGWMLAGSGGYNAELLGWHRWTGVAGVLGLLGTCAAHWKGKVGWYRGFLAATVLLVSVAGHHGGSLTHGADYLTRHAPGPVRRLLGGAPPTSASGGVAAKPVAGVAGVAGDAGYYESAVKPVIETYCVSCHGAEKSKGGLRLDGIEQWRKGGDGGPVVVAGKPAESALTARIRLPAEHDDHMPPTGKPQPSEIEVRRLEWWIGAGAPVTGTAEALGVPAAVR